MAQIWYAEPLDAESLQQGDIIRRTPEIDAVLEKIHAYYKKDDYRYLMVLTQSCDLVRREEAGTRCKARYISVAAVRPVEHAIAREIERLQSADERTYGVCDSRVRDKARQFIEKLLNNNEEEYFYLEPFGHLEHPDALHAPHCAFLALSIALKADLHYEKLLRAKLLQLCDSFQHKLGWLTGKMYSRVGTDDWIPKVGSSSDLNKRVTHLLGDNIVWIESSDKKEILAALRSLPEDKRTRKDVLREIEALKKKKVPKIQQVVSRVEELVRAHADAAGDSPLNAKGIRNLSNLLRADSQLADILKAK